MYGIFRNGYKFSNPLSFHVTRRDAIRRSEELNSGQKRKDTYVFKRMEVKITIAE